MDMEDLRNELEEIIGGYSTSTAVELVLDIINREKTKS